MKQITPTCAPRTAVAYARYSSAGQRDVSIEQQLNDIRAYAAREGYNIVHEYADHAKSGYKRTDKRTAFGQMLDAVDSGAFDTVLVWKVDRFGRSREDSAVCKGRLRRRGVRVVYVMEPIPDGSAGVLLEGMLEATAEWYSVNLSENVKRGMDDNASRCVYNGARVFGYTVDSSAHYVVCPEQAALVRRIYDMCLAGMTLSGIARALNDSGLRNPYGKPWAHTFIYRILTNEKYTGIYIWKETRVPDGMPVIIDRQKWEDTQAMLKRSVRSKSSNNPVEFLLTGKAFCGHCSKPMIGDSGTSKTGAVHHYYACQGKKRRSGCDKKSVPKQQLEDDVINYIFDHVLSGDMREKIAAAVIKAQQEYMASSPLAQMEKDLSDVNRKIDNINNAIAEGIWNSTTKEKLDELAAARDSLTESITSLRATAGRLATRENVLRYLDKFASLDRSNPEGRRMLINTFVRAVYVFDDHTDLYINAIEDASHVPLRSDNVSSAPHYGTHPNPGVLCFRIAKEKGP